MIVLHRLVAYSNHELSLENKIWKRIPYELMVQERSCFFKADSYLYYVVLFVCFVALRPKSTAMVIAGRSVHLSTLFPGQA